MSDGSAYASAELGTELRGEDPGEAIRNYAGLIDDERRLKLLNYYDSILDQPIEQTKVGQELIANAATETIDRAVRNGAVSQMKAATGLTGQSREGRAFYGDVAKKLEHEGSIGLVFGSPGSGKTATTIDVAIVWRARTGGAIIGNTEWDGFDAQFSSDKEMLEEMASIQGPVLAVVDEIAQELSGHGEKVNAAESFSNSMLQIRKRDADHGRYAKKGSALMTAHTRVKTAKSIRRIASFAIEKPTQDKPDRARLLTSEGGKDVWDQEDSYQGLTDSSANYSEYDPSDFEIVLDDSDDDGDDEDATPERNSEIEKVIRLTQDPDIDLTNKEAAKRTENPRTGDPYSKGWVDRVVADWRNERDHQWVDLDFSESPD